METTRTWLQEMLWYENYGKSVPTGWGNVFACSILTIGGVLGSNLNFEMMKYFFPIIFLI